MTAPLRLNPAASVRVESIGTDCPVLVVDDVYADPDAVRALALRGRYDASLAYYPGLHSDIPAADLQDLYADLARLLGALGRPAVPPRAFSSDFSVVTTPAAQMLAGQKHPHVDGLPLAGVVYLSPGLEVGTSFFRHVPTGLALLRTEPEAEAYNLWLREHGETTQPDTYAVEQPAVWERLHTVAGRYNRLALYPGNAFHSIDMRDVVPQHTMATARLTQRLFLNTAG